MKAPIIAAMLSGILPGAGQIYNHRWLRGLGFLIPVLFLSGFLRRKVILSGGSLVGLLPQDLETLLAQIILLAVAIWSVADAYKTAR